MRLYRMANQRLEYQCMVLAPDLPQALESWEAEVKRAFSAGSRGTGSIAPDEIASNPVRLVVHPDALGGIGTVPTVLPATADQASGPPPGAPLHLVTGP